eukprot:1159877-Pelagomonas_calceolata.AAC.19
MLNAFAGQHEAAIQEGSGEARGCNLCTILRKRAIEEWEPPLYSRCCALWDGSLASLSETVLAMGRIQYYSRRLSKVWGKLSLLRAMCY